MVSFLSQARFAKKETKNSKVRGVVRCLGIALNISIVIGASINVGYTGPYHADGNLFTIEAKAKQVSIRRFDINLDAKSTVIEVYSRPGLIVTNDINGGWTLIQSVQVNGLGKGNATQLPLFTYPVSIPPGSKQSFYVTSNNQSVDVWYSSGQKLEQLYANDTYLNVLEGYAVGYKFVGASGPRRWNGHVHYSFDGELITNDPTNAPSGKPTKQPTAIPTSDPSLPPTPQVCYYPSTYPMLLPTAKFTPMPTSKPTLLPTTKLTFKPTTKPTSKPSNASASSLTTSQPMSVTSSPNVGSHVEQTLSPVVTPSVPTNIPENTLKPTQQQKPSSANQMRRNFNAACSIVILWITVEMISLF